MSGRFAGKVVVVTGAAGVLGRAAAVRFASEGARIVLVDLAGAPVDESTAAVQQAGGEVHAVAGDVTRSADAERYAEEAVARFGGIDVLLNNAGIEGVVAPLVEYPEDVFDRVLAVNVRGVWLGMKAVAPRMRQRGGGAIVNTASIAGVRGTPRYVAYGASKHAVVGMTRTAAIELAPWNIRVNAVCPTFVESRMMRSLERGMNPEDPDAAKRRLESLVPMGRYGRPEEVAALMAFLASDDASYVNGAAYRLDGGRTA